MDHRRFFHRSIKPLTILSSFLGLFPITFNLNEIKIAEVSKIRLVYGFFLSVIFSAISFVSFFRSEMQEVDDIVFKLTGVIYPAITVNSCIGFLCQAKLFSKLLDTYFHFTNFLKDRKFYLKLFWVLIGHIFMQFSVVVSYYVLLSVSNTSFVTGWLSLFNLIANIYITYALDFVNFLQIYSLLFLCKIMSFLNFHLKYLEADGNDVKRLVSAFMSVYDTCEIVNSVFGVSATSRSIYTLTDFVVLLYWLFLSGANWIATMILLSWVSLQQWFLIFSCESVSREVRLLVTTYK